MKRANEIGALAVLGGGTMGSGIAQVAAQAGLRVVLYDVTQALADVGRTRIESSLDVGVSKGKVTPEDRQATLERIAVRCDLSAAVTGADVVIEAAPERLELKREIFGTVARVVAADALLASNTSSLSITKLAEGLASPERVLGMHFFNPPPLMKLLEIVRGAHTSDEAVTLARDLGVRLGKEPIVVKDSPGFASSRLGIALGLEAMRMLEEGVASPPDIDKAMKLGYRHPMGPLELTDLVGLDVRLDIAEHLARELDDRRFAPPEILRRLVREGHVGKKVGHGFYRWISGEPQWP